MALIRDGRVVIVVDPGMVPSTAAILSPLGSLGLDANAVTDVVFSHHHPDHTLSAALFPDAAFHDHWVQMDNGNQHWWKIDHDATKFPLYAAAAKPSFQSELDNFFAEVAFTHLSQTGVHERDTSHFALLEAFAPRALLEEAHAFAEARGYRAHEFGDAVLVLPSR